MKFLFTFLSISLIPILSYAQISIEERVEINPTNQQIMSDDPTSSHTIQLDVQWNTPQYNAAIVGVVVPCQSAGADWQNGGTISLTIDNAMAGLYRLQPRFNTPSGVLTHVIYQLYFDGTQVLSGERDVPGGFSGGSFPYFNIDYTPPLASNFNFNLDNNESCMLTLTPIAISTFNDCSTGISWYKNTQPVNLTFTSGGEFASFYDFNSQLIGNNFSGTFSEFQDIFIIQDSVYSGSEDKYFIVQCEWGGIVKTDSVRLRTQIGDVIVANTSGIDSLYTGQEMNVEVYPNNFGGQCNIFFPFEATYNAEIVEGNEYGNLIDPNTGEHVQSFTELYHYFSYAYFDYAADGISADSVGRVVIRIGTSIPTIPSTYLTLYIKPPPIYVYTVPEIVGADDTADVIIKHRLEDGTLEDFPPEQTFELAVLDGCVNGNFMVGDSINVYFADALEPIKFVTADSLESDSGYVRLRVGTDVSGFMRPIGNITAEEDKHLTAKERELIGGTGYTRRELRAGFEKMMEEKWAESLAEKLKTGGEPSPEVPIIEACALNQSARPFYWEWDEKYEDDKTIEILLGETKYFQAKYVGELLDKLVIEEVSGPELNGGLEIDVWLENPVAIVEGDKIGVYWEKEKHIFGTTDILPRGLIRIVGRYWEEEQTYKVMLTAKNGLDEPTIEITVKKPSVLYSEDFTGDSYLKARDVFNVEYNVDSLCFYYGGLYGIPPQMIKGQMVTESAKKTFTFDDGTSGRGFAPSYRYEPYTTQFHHNHLYANNPFVVSDGSMGQNGAAGIPTQTDHMHVRFTHYVETPTTVWDFVEVRSQFVDANNPSYFGARVTAPQEDVGKMTTVYYTINRLYNAKQREVENGLKILYGVQELDINQQLEANEITRNEFVSFLQDEWDGGIDGGTRGLNNIYAQTRIAASYGLLQILYPTAINTGTSTNYSITNEDRPENLNVISTGMLYMFNHQFYLFNEHNGFSITSNNNWDTEYVTGDADHFPQPNSGFEEAFRVMYHRWNRWLRDDNDNYIYALHVINNSNNYLPR